LAMAIASDNATESEDAELPPIDFGDETAASQHAAAQTATRINNLAERMDAHAGGGRDVTAESQQASQPPRDDKEPSRDESGRARNVSASQRLLRVELNENEIDENAPATITWFERITGGVRNVDAMGTNDVKKVMQAIGAGNLPTND